MQRLYFDNNATTACAPEVLAAMLPWLGERCGNPSSSHVAGEEAADALRAARASVARLLGTSPREIVFTSGGTESIATAIGSALAATPSRPRVVASRIEHASVLRNLEASGRELHWIDVDANGQPDVERARALVDERCALLALQWANNELGTCVELGELCAHAHARGVLVHVDAVQAAGKTPIRIAPAIQRASDGRMSTSHPGRVQERGLDRGAAPAHPSAPADGPTRFAAPDVDYLAISAHKLHGPKGAGALWVRPGAPFTPRQLGGPQESGRRAGTENVPAIVGFGRACDLAREWLAGPGPAELARARDAFEAALLERCAPAHVHARSTPRLPNTSNLRFDGVDAETLLALLSSSGVCASAGSACHAGARQPSHVLTAIGLAPEAARATVRCSFSRFTTAEELATGVERIASAVRALRSG